MFAHKIRGTGATLGMDSLSDLAGELEALLTKLGGISPAAQDLAALNHAARRLFEDIERLLA
jgi:HPt (histidine-containing phosphotransfer) domain-containing protein